MYGRKPAKTERYESELEATEQLFDSSVSNKNKSLEVVQGPKWTKKCNGMERN